MEIAQEAGETSLPNRGEARKKFRRG